MSLSAFSQDLIWVDRVGANGNCYAFDTKYDDFENVTYSTGRVKGICTFGEDSSMPSTPPDLGDRDVFLTSIDDTGELLWVKRFGGLFTDYGQAIEVDEESIYVSGYFSDSMFVDSDTIVSVGEQDAYIAKFNKNGDLIWLNRYGYKYDDRITETYLIDDRIYLAGEFDDTLYFGSDFLENTVSVIHPLRSTSFIACVDTSGNPIWAEKQQSTRGVQPQDIVVHEDHVYFVGNCYGNTEFGDVTYVSINPVFFDQFFSKYTTDGNHVHTSLYGGTANDIANNLCIGEDNNFYLAGSFEGTVDYGDSSYTVTSTSAIILKIDSSGAIKNSFLLDCPAGGSFDGVDYDGRSVYVGGYGKDSLFINNDTIDLELNNDIVLLELSTDFEYRSIYYVLGASHDQIRSIDCSESGNIAIAGSFRNFLDFGIKSYTTLAATYDGFMGLICPKANAEVEYESMNGCESGITFSNSSSNYVSYTWEILKGTVLEESESEIVLTNTIGDSVQVKLIIENSCSIDSIISPYIEVFSDPTLNLAGDSVLCDFELIGVVFSSGIYDSLYWTAGSDNPDSLVVNSTGYVSCIAYLGDCQITDSIYFEFVDCLGIGEKARVSNIRYSQLERFIIFDFLDNYGNISYYLYNLEGKLVQTGTSNEGMILVQNKVLPGLYVLQLDAQGRNYHFKIVVT